MNHSTHTLHSTAIEAADYIVVVSNEDDYHAGYHHFAEKVNRKLKAGYLLHGAPFTVKQALCQAMVRPGGPAPSGDTTVFFKQRGAHHG